MNELYILSVLVVTCVLGLFIGDIREAMLIKRKQRSDQISKFIMGETNVLPTGCKFTPLYKKCPSCGCDLTKQPKDSLDHSHQSPYVSKKSAAYKRLIAISLDTSRQHRLETYQELLELRQIWEDLNDCDDDQIMRIYRWVLSKISKIRTMLTPREKG